MTQAKKDQNDETDSITEFSMHNFKCPRAENGHYQWNCVWWKCSQWFPFEFASSEQKIKIGHTEVTQKRVDKISKTNWKSIPWYICPRCLFKSCVNEKVVYNA